MTIIWRQKRRNLEQTKNSNNLCEVDIKKPESVKQYEENMVILQEMEQNFKQSTLDLQKKLGLPIDGFVWLHWS